MLKLLLCMFSALAIGVVILQLRQQRLELNHQANQIHNQIEACQAKLWNQQLQIAIFTAPNAIQSTVDAKKLGMVPRTPPPAPARASWIDTTNNPDAE